MGTNARIISYLTNATSGVPPMLSPPGGVQVPAAPLYALTDGSGNILSLVDNGDGTATLKVAFALSGVTAATLANVASSASNTTLFAAASGQVNGRTITNDSTAALYVKFGATASTSSYTVLIPAGGYYEFPGGPNLYAGQVDGIWASANGNARTTQW